MTGRFRLGSVHLHTRSREALASTRTSSLARPTRHCPPPDTVGDFVEQLLVEDSVSVCLSLVGLSQSQYNFH
eukprot:2152563-Rhodomonas_salina.1